MAANICIRGGFERFDTITPPTASFDYWEQDKSLSYHCLDTTATPEKSVHEQPHKMAVCNNCHREIADQYILRVHPNLEFHAHCLKCFECCCPLDEQTTAFVKHGRTYCRSDYKRLFAAKCTRCASGFDSDELVMRVGVDQTFHLRCFTCVACDKRLQTGDEFLIKNNRLYCRADCECGNVPDTSNDYVPPPSTSSLINMNNNNNAMASTSFDDDLWETSTLTSLDNHTSPPLSPKSDGSPMFGSAPYPQHSNGSSSSSGGGGGKKKKDKQTTRVRTVLNETQLKILKECYSVNSRPDALLKERLVEMTGLNARVIRVWFQNKRCKDKKRQIQMHESRLNSEREEVLSRVRVNGIGPLMVSAATNHVDMTPAAAPMDIHHYAQWNENAMMYDGGASASFPTNNLYTDYSPQITSPRSTSTPKS